MQGPLIFHRNESPQRMAGSTARSARSVFRNNQKLTQGISVATLRAIDRLSQRR
jgi:hypothetical protein